ncbi:MAG: hypothetical protein ACOVMI_04945 [Chitinophagaceae bacterium]
MSFNLWMSNRLFPVIPVHQLFQNTNQSIHFILYILSICTLLITILYKPQKALLIILFFAEILACLLDYTRWQPWQFQYLSMLFVCIICFNDFKKATQWIALIMASIYIFSGLHKLNYHFLQNMWSQTILKDFLGLNQNTIIQFKLTKIGYVLPIVETLAGFGLLSKFWQKKAAKVLIIMHLILLIILGPLGLNYNQIVWPWNVAMIVFVYHLFIKNKTPIVNFNLLLSPRLYIIALLWLVMPIFSFWNKWPHYLSNDLYSGKALGMQIIIKDKEIEKHPLAIYANTINNEDSIMTISIQNWAMSELKTPQFPEWFYYQKLSLILKEKYNNNIRFNIYNSPKKDSLNTILNKP